MPEELLDRNPNFIRWAEENGINLDAEEDWLIWAQCWADGYNHGVEDVKTVI